MEETTKRPRGRPRKGDNRGKKKTQRQLWLEFSGGQPLRCATCGRPVRQMKFGNMKQAHLNCSIIESLFKQLEDRLLKVKWNGPANVTAMRSRLFTMRNSLFNSTKHFTFAPDDDEEF